MANSGYAGRTKQQTDSAIKRWFTTAHGPLYACVHLTEFPAQALLRLRLHLHSAPVAVLEGVPAQERVCAVNAAARREGLRRGMLRVEAESFAGITLLPRSTEEEANAYATLLACAGSYSPEIETCHTASTAVCVLRVAGVAQLYSSPQAFAQALREALRSHGLYASIAVSANFHSACLLAKATTGITIAVPSEEQKALAPLLLHVLELNEQQAKTMALWGIRTLGGLAALPLKQLVAQLGSTGIRLRELARGEHAHLFASAAIPLELREQYTFEAPVRLLEGLLFVLEPMLEQLVLRARERTLAIASVTMTLALSAKRMNGDGDQLHTEQPAKAKVRSEMYNLDARNLHLVAPMLAEFRAAAQKKKAAPPAPAAKLPIAKLPSSANIYRRVIRPKVPVEDKRLLLKLLQLDLAAHPPSSSVLAITLEAEAGGKAGAQDGSFAPNLQ